MNETSREKHLESNEHLFIVIDNWMKKYDTSPKSLITSEEVPSIDIEWNEEELTPVEKAKTLKAFKEWARRSGKVVIITGVCVSIYATAELIIQLSNNSKNQEKNDSSSIVSEDEETKLTAGVYYLDENNEIVVDEVLPSNDELMMGNTPDFTLPGDIFLNNSAIKKSFNQLLEGYMYDKMRSLDPLVDETLVPEEPVVETQALEEPEVPEEVIPEIPNVILDNGAVEISIPSSVRQTGICRNFTSYAYFYGRWSKNTGQREVSELWGDAGKPSSNGIATLNDRYLVAVSTKFGKVGDSIDIVLKDGQVIPAIIADAKGADATSEWGHVLGSGNAVDIVEWESSGPKSEINLGSWANVKVDKIINYGNHLYDEVVVVAEEIEDVEETYEVEAVNDGDQYTEIDGLNEADMSELSEEEQVSDQKVYTLN